MEETGIKISRRKLKQLINDPVKTAEAIDLVYVSDATEGIRRIRKGKAFSYRYRGKTVTDAPTLHRIRSLVIPPAWEEVWICADPSGHLQVTGFDARKRKQYRYHPLWNALRNHTKYFNLYNFGTALPSIRRQVAMDLQRPGLPQEKVLAAVVSLMQCTCIRIGSSVYEKLNGSFGLTTLKDQHVKIDRHHMKFSFRGKKGIYHDVSLRSKKLARIVQACKDIPGKELFQYYDEDGHRRSIDSGMVNGYIRTISGGSFTAKDFRTWAGTLHALSAFRKLGAAATETEAKRKINEALDMVSRQLNNTRAVCRKYYVHPAIIDAYTEQKLPMFFPEREEADCTLVEEGLTAEEETLMKILSAASAAVSL